MEHILFILLGLIQGLTEFLPVSSSGHLALAQKIFQMAAKESLTIEIMAHLGSLLAIFIYYKNEALDYLQSNRKNYLKSFPALASLFVSTLPAGFAGLFLKDEITTLFNDTKSIALAFLFTSFALGLIYFMTTYKKSFLNKDWPSLPAAFFIGCAQALALLPGVSRSGTTISAGILTGLKPERAAFFSFCSVSPLILAAASLSFLKLLTQSERLSQSESPLNLALLLISSFLFGWLGLSLVVKFLKQGRFHWFAAYLIPLALGLLIWGI